MEKKWLDVTDIQERYGVSKNTAYRIIREIAHYHGGYSICHGKLLLTEVEAWERRNCHHEAQRDQA